MADDIQSQSLKDVGRRVNSSKRSISIETDSNQNEVLDPRIHAELEKLNKTSDDINFLEREADQLRTFIQQTNAISTQKLIVLAEKLGSCVGKAKPYYEARIKLREAVIYRLGNAFSDQADVAKYPGEIIAKMGLRIQIKAQGVAHRFEMACSDLALAKEMVHVAEDCYAALGRPDDSAWQEMLNHSTSKVNEAELERKKTELEHEKMTQGCTEVQREVTVLQKEQKRSIAKSRPYFQLKAEVNQEMEGNKTKLNELESSLAEAKAAYSNTLRSLERISDEIHQKRQQNHQTRKRISRHDELNHFVSDLEKACNEESATDSGAEKVNADVKKNVDVDLCLSASVMQDGRSSSAEQNQTDTFECSIKTIQNDSVTMNEMGSKANIMSTTREESSDAIQSKKMLSEQPELMPLVTPNKNEIARKSITAGGSLSKIPEISLTIQLAESDPAGGYRYSAEAVLDPCHTNAEVMQSIMQLKSASIAPPAACLNLVFNHLGDENSDKDSITSSFANANVLSDEQIESLMLDTADYKKTLERMNPEELGQFKGLELPAKLSYLQDYVTFDPIWIEDDFDNFDKKAGKFVVAESNYSVT